MLTATLDRCSSLVEADSHWVPALHRLYFGREGDANAPAFQGMAARVGGEEFAVLLADTDATSAAGVAERIRSQIAQAEAMPVAAVTVSIGVATLQAQERPDSLQHRADQALYMAKSQGRNRVVSAP